MLRTTNTATLANVYQKRNARILKSGEKRLSRKSVDADGEKVQR
jgi:hypothetical protein